jgi:hypothetical protein
VPTGSAYLDYSLFNLHVAMCDNDNVVTDEVKLINKYKIKVQVEGPTIFFIRALKYVGLSDLL